MWYSHVAKASVDQLSSKLIGIFLPSAQKFGKITLHIFQKAQLTANKMVSMIRSQALDRFFMAFHSVWITDQESRSETLLWGQNIVLLWGITKPFQQNEVPCYACKEFRALKSKCYFQSCILFEYRARNFIFWKGLVIPQMLRSLRNVSNLDSNILGSDAHFERGNFEFYKIERSPKAWKLLYKKQESDRNLIFQGVNVSRLKTPVCEVTCGVVTTMRQRRVRTVITLCKDLSPR